MLSPASFAATLAVAFALVSAGPAAATGEILITHAKALAGNVTPGDGPGYPIKLSRSGTYQFAGPLLATAGNNGIVVTSPDVTIDMNGFRLHGKSAANHGIVGLVDSVTVQNGTITRFRFDEIVGQGSFWIVENMRIVSNGRDGFATTGVSNLIQGSVVAENGRFGIKAARSTVLGNTINNNDDFGIVGEGTTGFGNNTMVVNNPGGAQVSGATPLEPNFCSPSCFAAP